MFKGKEKPSFNSCIVLSVYSLDFFLFKQYFISQKKKDKTAGVSLYNI